MGAQSHKESTSEAVYVRRNKCTYTWVKSDTPSSVGDGGLQSGVEVCGRPFVGKRRPG